MTDKEKEPYFQLGREDKIRYDKQTLDLYTQGYFTTEDGTKSTDLPVDPVKKYGPDVFLPKKQKTSFCCFLAQNSKLIREKNPSLSGVDLMAEAQKIWKNMSESQKAPYVEDAKEDLKRYHQQMDDLNKNGFFIMPDGSKSSAHRNKKKSKTEESSDEIAVKENPNKTVRSKQ